MIFDEAEILLDRDEIPVEIGIEERRTANRLIEEFMLAANQTVAEHFYWMEYLLSIVCTRNLIQREL